MSKKYTKAQQELINFASEHYSEKYCSHYSPDNRNIRSDESKTLALELYRKLYNVLRNPTDIPNELLAEIPFLMSETTTGLWSTNTTEQKAKIIKDPLVSLKRYDAFVKNYYTALSHTTKDMYDEHSSFSKNGLFDGRKSGVYEALVAPDDGFGTMEKERNKNVMKQQAGFIINHPNLSGIADYFSDNKKDQSLLSTFAHSLEKKTKDGQINQTNISDRIFFCNLNPYILGTQAPFFFAKFDEQGCLDKAIAFKTVSMDITKDLKEKRIPYDAGYFDFNLETIKEKDAAPIFKSMTAFSNRIKAKM